jgi:hypothetical protein
MMGLCDGEASSNLKRAPLTPHPQVPTLTLRYRIEMPILSTSLSNVNTPFPSGVYMVRDISNFKIIDRKEQRPTA